MWPRLMFQYYEDNEGMPMTFVTVAKSEPPHFRRHQN
jgi:hypothetical protein